MAQDIERTKKTPATGSEAGSQGMTDYNLAAIGSFRLPNGGTLTLNGASPDEDYYIRGFEGNIYIWYEGDWKQISINEGSFIIASPDTPQNADIDIVGDLIVTGVTSFGDILPSGTVSSTLKMFVQNTEGVKNVYNINTASASSGQLGREFTIVLPQKNGDIAICEVDLSGEGERAIVAAPDGRLKVSSAVSTIPTLQQVATQGSSFSGKIQIGTTPTNPTDVVRLQELYGYALLAGTNVFTRLNQFNNQTTFVGLGRANEFEFTRGATLVTGNSDYYSNNAALVYSKNNKFTINNGENDKPASFSNLLLTTARTYSLPDKDDTLATLSDISAATGTTVNSSASTLALNQRGYYNYIASGGAAWTLPSVVGISGRFYRIYNKASDGASSITITPNGTDKFFQGGARLSTISLMYGENLTLVSDGIDWNIYG